MITIKDLHTFQKLVSDGIADPVLCLEGHIMIPCEENNNPAFTCPFCGQITGIGVTLQQQVSQHLA